MKHLFTLLFLMPFFCLGQTNLVFTTPNSNSPGNRNTLIGPGAGNPNGSGSGNVFIGDTVATGFTNGFYNIFIGGGVAGNQTSGVANVFLGFNTGRNNTGSYNFFQGYYTGVENTSGSNNIFLGRETGTTNTIGGGNTFLGYQTGFRNNSGNYNVFLGNQAGYNNQSGANNIFIGPSAGNTITTGSYNIMLGANARTTNNNLLNAVALGTDARVALDNAIVLGNPDNSNIAVGIGTDSPQFPLDVRGTINLRNNGRIKFAHLSNPLRNGTTDRFLTVNEQGETELARYRLSIDNVNQWSDKVFEKDYALKPLAEVETHIQQHGHLPNVPSAKQVVEEGIDPAKMDAKLLEKIEELTLYSIQQQKRIDQLEQLLKQVLIKK
ncbi:hypothetical protein GCM10027592_03690 [Spirosoma flavus]